MGIFSLPEQTFFKSLSVMMNELNFDILYVVDGILFRRIASLCNAAPCWSHAAVNTQVNTGTNTPVLKI